MIKYITLSITVLAALVLIRSLFVSRHHTAMPSSLRTMKKLIPATATLQTFQARDGETLSYRIYGNSPHHLMILIHGSSSHGGTIEPLAQELSSSATICVPTLRGHYESGSYTGDCSYVGQLEDDIYDLMKHLNYAVFQSVSMIGISSGGGFAIRFASSAYGSLIHNYVLLAPVIPFHKALMRKGSGWVVIKKIPTILLLIANLVGITRFNSTPLITFNKPLDQCNGTETLQYSYNLLFSILPHFDYQKDIAAIDSRALILVGSNDECIHPDQYITLFKKSPIHIFEKLTHSTLIHDKHVIEKIRQFCTQ